LDKVSQRKDFLAKDAELRMQSLQKTNESLRKQLDDRRHECNYLEEKISTLELQVSSSNNVKQSRDEARGAAGDPAAVATMKMKKIVGRRHLVDTARSQAEEIDFLRQELDKMRQRTFPSFVR
jgi:superfamily I DNA and RNA helicase